MVLVLFEFCNSFVVTDSRSFFRVLWFCNHVFVLVVFWLALLSPREQVAMLAVRSCVHLFWFHVLLLFLLVRVVIVALPENEPRHDKTNKMNVRPALTSAQSDQSLRCPHEETLSPLLTTERTAKTRWSAHSDQSSLVAQSFCLFCHEAAKKSFYCCLYLFCLTKDSSVV